MSKFTSTTQKLNLAFLNLSEILEIESRSDFFITDYEGQSFLVLSVDTADNTYKININKIEQICENFEKNKVFEVENSKLVGFIPIDGKYGLLKFDDSYCDCIIFDENDFCFLEFKLNATSLEVRAVRKNRKKAVKQLGNTIQLFDEKMSNDYEGLKLEAYVGTPETYPRENTAWESLKVEFLETYGIELFEGIKKRCR
jgi:hypothetical protein